MPEPLQFAAEPLERKNDERRIRTWPSNCGRYKVIETKSFLDGAHYWLAAHVLETGGEYPIHLRGNESHHYRNRAAAEEACNIHANPTFQFLSRSESIMARKGKTAATKTTKQPKAKKDPKPGTEKKLSALDAAAEILGKKKEPMTTKEMVEAMAAAGLWESPGGKTPHATLYSAILREISGKGKESRFVKSERGKFALAS